MVMSWASWVSMPGARLAVVGAEGFMADIIPNLDALGDADAVILPGGEIVAEFIAHFGSPWYFASDPLQSLAGYLNLFTTNFR
jgi:hypothetical protein